jgi:hypothetical protein
VEAQDVERVARESRQRRVVQLCRVRVRIRVDRASPASTSSASCSFPLSSCVAALCPSSATTMVLTPRSCWRSTLGGRLRRPRRQV